MRPRRVEDDRQQKKSHFDNYSDYSRTLRAWLVAYGIGGPVLFVSNKELAAKVGTSAHAEEIIIAFLLGVALQIALALINKWSAWHMYAGAGDPDYQRSWRYHFWGFINDQSWVDFWIDVLSIAAFIWATALVLRIFLT